MRENKKDLAFYIQVKGILRPHLRWDYLKVITSHKEVQRERDLLSDTNMASSPVFASSFGFGFNCYKA